MSISGPRVSLLRKALRNPSPGLVMWGQSSPATAKDAPQAVPPAGVWKDIYGTRQAWLLPSAPRKLHTNPKVPANNTLGPQCLGFYQAAALTGCRQGPPPGLTPGVTLSPANWGQQLAGPLVFSGEKTLWTTARSQPRGEQPHPAPHTGAARPWRISLVSVLRPSLLTNENLCLL